MLRDILLFSTADLDHPLLTNKQHMALLFAKRGCRVAYVDSLGLRRPAATFRDLRRMGQRLLRALPLPREIRPNLWRLSPPALPFHASPAARACNFLLLRALLSLHLRLLGMDRPLIWTYNPVVADLCAALPHAGIVYHCVDDLRAAPRVDPASVREGEEKLGRIADLCFTTSPLLRDRMRPLFPKVVLEPNVCDPSLFGTARQAPPEPPELHGIPRPRLLLVGALSAYKVDFPLIRELAGRLPDTQWLLIGPTREGEPESALPPDSPNVRLLGPRPYDSLPSYMAHADAAVLPVPRNAYTDAMFPMKFFEYLAAGLPLVATRLPSLAAFEDLYFPADTLDDFLFALRAVLNGERKDEAAIAEACRVHSWEARFARMEAELRALPPLAGFSQAPSQVPPGPGREEFFGAPPQTPPGENLSPGPPDKARPHFSPEQTAPGPFPACSAERAAKA